MKGLMTAFLLWFASTTIIFQIMFDSVPPTFGEQAPPVIISKVDLWSPAWEPEGAEWCGDYDEIYESFGSLQWIEIHNTSNDTLDVTELRINSLSYGKALSSVVSYLNLELGPEESCLIQTENTFTMRSGVGGNEGFFPPPNHHGTDLRITYHINDDNTVLYESSTPWLNDEYGDAGYWELVDGEWISIITAQ